MIFRTTCLIRKRKNIEGNYFYVKELPSGADCFDAFDKDGHFLGGLIISQENAELIADNGYVVNPDRDTMSDLSWWVAWNDAVQCGVEVMEDPQGTQIMSLGHDVYMTVRRAEDGWDMDIIDDVELGDRYYSKEGEYFNLKIVPKDKAYWLE